MRTWRALLAGLLSVSCLALLGTSTVLGNNLGRDRDPVVLSGTDLPDLIGLHPDSIVAFRWDSTAFDWSQIPVQVDERAVVDFGAIYDTTASGFTVLTYTDTSTFTGADPNPLFDTDDELAFRARDAGDTQPPGIVGPGSRLARVNAMWPPGTTPAPAVEVTITDPLTFAVGYVYLFRSDGHLDPRAGVAPIDYQFVLLSGHYKTTYNPRAGPNPENSRVTTANYSVHFADRWIRDETRITAGGATGVDILDRHKNLFGPGDCSRSENTFSAGEGAFIVNRAGPVRALRGYLGANSGPTTWRLHKFYETREDISTALRVHPIPGLMDYFDYSPAASGMTYSNSWNPAGALIDGSPDAVAPGPPQWEMVSGPQGTMVATSLIATDIPGLALGSYYSDDDTPPTTQCTGDSWEYGASGLWIDQGLPNTDPALAAQYGGQLYTLTETRIHAFDAPGKDWLYAQHVDEQNRNALSTQAVEWWPPSGVEPFARPFRGLALSPNPARGPVRIRLSLAREARVVIRVFDAAGRMILTLAEGPWSAGAHDFRWDASGLAPGVYLVRATIAGRDEATVRLALIR